MTTLEDEKIVVENLNLIKNIPARDENKASLTRAKYLSEVKALSQMKPVAVPVSHSLKHRLNGWIGIFRNSTLRKERYSMFTTLATICTVIALAFGGAGATVYAAQDSLPNDLLYPLKIASEEFRMNIATETQTQFQLSLEFANRRMAEISEIVSNGEGIPQEVMLQLQSEYQKAFKLAAGLSDAELTPALLRLQATLRQHQQIMAGLSSSENEPILARIRQMLQTQEQICESGLADPLMFRIRMREQQQNGNLAPVTEPPANNNPENSQGQPQGQPAGQGQGSGAPSGGGSITDPNNSTGSNNPGTGSGTCTDCVPVEGSGPGPGPDAGNGGGSENSTPPQDGTGNSVGPNENPGSGGGNTNPDPGNGNNQPEQPEEEDPGNGNSDGSSSNPDNPNTPGTEGSEDSGGGKGKP